MLISSFTDMYTYPWLCKTLTMFCIICYLSLWPGGDEIRNKVLDKFNDGLEFEWWDRIWNQLLENI